MMMKRAVSAGVVLVLASALGPGMAFAADNQPRGSAKDQPSEFGRAGNKGEGFSEQETIKGKGQIPESTIEQDVQVTIGGARPVVEGEVLRVSGEDYIIKDSTGGEVRLRLNKDTNIDCAMPTTQGATMSTGRQRDEQQEIPPTAHMQEQMSGAEQGSTRSAQDAQRQEQLGQQIVEQQREAQKGGGEGQQSASSGMSGERIGDQSGTQPRSALGKESGGDVALGSGFTIGPKTGCAFKVGDKVRAEVSDLGTVLYIKQIGRRDTLSQQRMSGQMIPPSEGATPGEKAAARQQAEMMKPGSAEAPGDLRDPRAIGEGEQTAKAAPPQNLCEGCKVIRGQVLQWPPLGSEQNWVVLKDESQKEIRLRFDGRTRIGTTNRSGSFLEGDYVEAYVTPDGYVWSMTLLKQQPGLPGAEGAPGA
ncbi:hypothetical protein [Candidatus Nitrospira bockiana]